NESNSSRSARGSSSSSEEVLVDGPALQPASAATSAASEKVFVMGRGRSEPTVLASPPSTFGIQGRTAALRSDAVVARSQQAAAGVLAVVCLARLGHGDGRVGEDRVGA